MNSISCISCAPRFWIQVLEVVLFSAIKTWFLKILFLFKFFFINNNQLFNTNGIIQYLKYGQRKELL